MSKPTELETAPTLVGATVDDSLDTTLDAAAPRITARELAAGQTVGQYVLMDAIGAGGMGIVYAAHDPKLDRRVAIKLLRPEISSDDIRGRSLLGEAKAMARLSHPNVCTVHEIGRADDRVFIVMEYVDGETLHAWLARKTRSWQDILEVMIHAGRGLDAAHQAGIIHRDFKPENVMIGHDGRVRVMDFGLAGEVRDVSAPASATLARASGDAALGQTLVGKLIGTPGYMAPEQLRLQHIDARSDQFAFCVAFYQALFGERPYPGKNLQELLDAFERGQLGDAPGGKDVPRWLRKILVRGLAIDPAGRHASMTELVAELIRVPGRRRLVRAGAAAAVFLAVGAALGIWLHLSSPADERPCTSAEERLAEVWNVSHKQAILRAFAATGLSYADEQSRRVFDIVDGYGRRWVDMHRDACEATRIRGEQSDEMLDRRMLCLDGRREELGALAALLAVADREVARNAAQAALSLGDLGRCAARESLLSAAPLPEDPAGRARVAEIREELAQAKVRMDSGKYQEALKVAENLARIAQDTGYAPLSAESLLLVGRLRGRLGELAASEQALIEALAVADRTRDDLLRAQAMSELARYVGYEKGDYERGQEWIKLGQAALARAGGDQRLESELLRNQGDLLYGLGELEAAFEHQRRALILREEVLGQDHPDVIEMLTALGGSLVQQRRHDDALAYLGRALDTAERVLGPEHPVVADSLNNLAGVYVSRGDVDIARDHYQRAKVIWEKSLGKDHMNVAIALSNLGSLALGEESYDEAISLYQQALAIEEATLSHRHVHLAVTVGNLGIAHLARGELGAAIEHLERAHESFGAAATADAAQVRFALGRALFAAGHRERGLALARSAHEVLAGLGDRFAAERAEIEKWLAQPQ